MYTFIFIMIPKQVPYMGEHRLLAFWSSVWLWTSLIRGVCSLPLLSWSRIRFMIFGGMTSSDLLRKSNNFSWVSHDSAVLLHHPKIRIFLSLAPRAQLASRVGVFQPWSRLAWWGFLEDYPHVKFVRAVSSTFMMLPIAYRKVNNETRFTQRIPWS